MGTEIKTKTGTCTYLEEHGLNCQKKKRYQMNLAFSERRNNRMTLNSKSKKNKWKIMTRLTQ